VLSVPTPPAVIEDVDLQIGDTALPAAVGAGASWGITCWGSAIVEAARRLRARLASEHGGVVPAGGLEVTAEMPGNPNAKRFAMHAFGAQFAEVRVRADSGEVRVPRTRDSRSSSPTRRLYSRPARSS